MEARAGALHRSGAADQGKEQECKALIAEKKDLPVYRVKRHKTLAVRIADRCNIFYGQEKSS